MEAMATRESILKRKLPRPSCGRLVTAKFLASRHVCERKRMGAPPGCKRRPKTESEVEEWTAKVQEKAIQAFLKRSGREVQPECLPDSAMHEGLPEAISTLSESPVSPTSGPAQ